MERAAVLLACSLWDCQLSKYPHRLPGAPARVPQRTSVIPWLGILAELWAALTSQSDYPPRLWDYQKCPKKCQLLCGCPNSPSSIHPSIHLILHPRCAASLQGSLSASFCPVSPLSTSSGGRQCRCWHFPARTEQSWGPAWGHKSVGVGRGPITQEGALLSGLPARCKGGVVLGSGGTHTSKEWEIRDGRKVFQQLTWPQPLWLQSKTCPSRIRITASLLGNVGPMSAICSDSAGQDAAETWSLATTFDYFKVFFKGRKRISSLIQAGEEIALGNLYMKANSSLLHSNTHLRRNTVLLNWDYLLFLLSAEAGVSAMGFNFFDGFVYYFHSPKECPILPTSLFSSKCWWINNL